MSLTKDQIVERRDTIIADAKEVQKRLEELSKATEENKNLLQALSGALQQCNMFVQEFDDDVSDDGND